MRESLNAVRRLCTTSSELSYVSPQWMDEIRNTHWLDHIRLLLESGIELVKLTIAGYPLLVHCRYCTPTNTLSVSVSNSNLIQSTCE